MRTGWRSAAAESGFRAGEPEPSPESTRARGAQARRSGSARGPADIAVGLGAVWVANAGGGSVSRIDPASERAGRPIAVGASQVLGVAVGEGRVWVARAGGFNGDRVQLVQIDPETRKLEGDPIAVPGGVPLDLVAGNGVWVTDSGSAIGGTPDARGGVTRVDPTSGAVAGPLLRTGERPSAIALGAGGVWVVNEGSGTLTPITLARPAEPRVGGGAATRPTTTTGPRRAPSYASPCSGSAT